jgi:hypothetical protein
VEDAWPEGVEPGYWPQSRLQPEFFPLPGEPWAPSAQPGAEVRTVSGLGCVGCRTQKAQCLPLPPPPGPALLANQGVSSARLGKEGHVTLTLTRGSAPALDPPAHTGLWADSAGWDQEAKLCPNLGFPAPALCWHPPRLKALQLALLGEGTDE